MDQQIKLELSVNEINIILSALGKSPYETVFMTVESLRRQVGPQLQAKQNSPEGELKGKVLPN